MTNTIQKLDAEYGDMINKYKSENDRINATLSEQQIKLERVERQRQEAAESLSRYYFINVNYTGTSCWFTV